MEIYEYNVLLIDDDEDDFIHLNALSKGLIGSKIKISWKKGFDDGLTALRDGKYDLCLLDQRLGARTGIELLFEANKSGRACPVIILTGQSDFDLDVRAMQVGAADFLVKSQLTAPLLERAVRYTIKHDMDMRELRENKAQLLQQDRLASLGLLASSLAHEIGTPLGIIRSRAELAQKRSGSTVGFDHDMNVIVSQIDKITKLVNALLNLARGQRAESTVAVPFDQVMDDVLNLISHELKRKNIRFKENYERGLMLRAEAGPLGQVLLNLFVNAIHAIEARKDTQGGAITLSTSVVNDFVIINIDDTGTGIADEHMPQIFKPFFTTKDIGQGTGLGLATSFKIIQSWGGHIRVESKWGSGTRFELQIPKIKSSDIPCEIPSEVR